MNIERLLTSLMNRFLRKGLMTGLNKGLGKLGGNNAPKGAPLDKSAREMQKRARQAAKITRRLGR